MLGIQETLNKLQPYVKGIRYYDQIPIVDMVVDDGWEIPKPHNENIKSSLNENTLNTYIIYTNDKDIGFDDLLLYVSNIIKLNKEIEFKTKLLNEKISELKKIFISNDLEKLKLLQFTFDATDKLFENNDSTNIDDKLNDNPE